MRSFALKTTLIAAAAGLMLAAMPADAGPSRTELLAGHDSRVGHPAAGVRDAQHARDRHRRHQYRDARGHQRSRHDGGHGPTYKRKHGRSHEREHGRNRNNNRQHHYASARRYAANAVRQARQAHQLGYYPNHPRWSLNFQRHFEWARGTDSYRLEREARKRARKLRELRRYDQYPYGY